MLVVLGLIIAFVLIAVFSNRSTRQCRWREFRHETGSRWSCVQCGAVVEGKRGETPTECLKNKDQFDQNKNSS